MLRSIARPSTGTSSSTGGTGDEQTAPALGRQGQSPWLDNLTRPYLRDGTLADLVAGGVRGVTANATIVAEAIEASNAYDDQFAVLLSAVGLSRTPTGS